MRRWRLTHKGIAALGAFALLLQLVVSLGHVHAQNFKRSDVFAGNSLSQRVIIERSARPDQGQIPDGLPDDDCPICAAMHVAAFGLLPSPPSVLAPVNFARESQAAYTEEFSISNSRYILFQTRAPPTA